MTVPSFTAPAGDVTVAFSVTLCDELENDVDTLDADVVVGSCTVSVKVCEASGEIPFEAVIVRGYVPPVPSAGVPESVAVPSPLSVNETPDGSAPDSLSDGVGTPLVVTVKLPARPVWNVVFEALVMAGAETA